MPEFILNCTLISILKGDITDQDTDAIVNAANSSLLGGGGVDGAIHGRGGPSILEECRKIQSSQWPNGLPTGKAVITSGGNLKARYVIHTVGPIWRGGFENEQQLLEDAYRNSLFLAGINKLSSISFPSISTGAYGYPIEQAGKVALKTTKMIAEQSNEKCHHFREIRFVLFSERDMRVYERISKEELLAK